MECLRDRAPEIGPFQSSRTIARRGNTEDDVAKMRLDGRLCASTIAITAALAAAAGCGGNSGNGTTSHAATATSTPVAVVRCPTTFGADGQHVPPTPATMPAVLTPRLSKALSFYVGGLTVLGPAGWKCSSSVGADGRFRNYGLSARRFWAEPESRRRGQRNPSLPGLYGRSCVPVLCEC